MKFINAISLPDKLIRLFAMFIATMTLAACGGGGDGFPGVHPALALYTTAPTGGVTIAAAGTGVYTIGGGVVGYTAVTSNSAVATANVLDSTLTISGLSGGAATIEVRDAAGTTLSLAVTVTPAKTLPLFTTAPSTLTIALGTAPTYTIGGGTAPYTVVSSNTLVSVANLIGTNTLSTTGTSAGTAQVQVLDSTGTSVNIAVTVVGSSTPLYVMVPDGGVTIGAPGTGVYTIGGGTPGYTAISSNPAVATVNVVGTTLTVTGVSGGAVTVAVYDAALGKVSLAVTVVAAKPLATTAPTVLELGPWGSGHAVSSSYEISGGTAPYSVTSGDVSVVQVNGEGSSAVGSLFFLVGNTAGTAQVKILDSSNNELIITVTVAGPAIALYTTAPAAVTIATGAAPSYAIGGGTAPYTVVSSNVIIATANVTTGTTLNIVGLAAGSANVVVTDAVSKTLTIAVTVSSTTSTPVVATPSAATATVGDTLTFIVSGGSPAYSFVVNNPSIASVYPASVTSSGGTFRVTLLSGGSTTVAIVDALGQTATFTVTAAAPVVVPPPAPTPIVPPPAPIPIALSPSALSLAETYATPITIIIQNGTGPYKGYTSDSVLSSVTVAGSTLTVGVGTQGNRCITPIAAYGTYAITITVVDALGASATSVLTIQDNGRTCP